MIEFPCKDCKHCKVGLIGWLFGNYEYAKCHRDGHYTLDKVSGKRRYGIGYCDIDRKYEYCCGAEAKYFEPKPSKEIQYYEAMQDRTIYKEKVAQMYADLKELDARIWDNIDVVRFPDELENYSLRKIRAAYVKGERTFVQGKLEYKRNVIRNQAMKDAKKDVTTFIRKKFQGEKLIIIKPEKLVKEIEDMK